MKKKFTLLLYLLLFLTCFSSFSQVTVFQEGFENNGLIPANWTQEYVYDTLNWTFTNGGNNSHPQNAYSGNYNALLYYGGVYRKTKLITPGVNLTYYNNVSLEFYHTQEEYSGDQDNLRVYYKTSASGSWTLLKSYTTNVSTWTKRTISLPNTNSSDYYIAFEGDARYGYGVCVDDVKIKGNVANGLDVKLVEISSPVIWAAGNNTLKIKYKNTRSDTIKNVDFGYSIDTQTAVKDTNYSISGYLMPNEEKTYTFSQNISLSKGSHSIQVWVNKPNRTLPDDNKTNDTLTLFFKTGIQDTFYIDSSGNGDYTTFAAAIADVNNGVTGPTVFIVRKGTYKERIVIGDIPGASSINPVIFQGVHQDSVKLTFQGATSSKRATIVFKGGDHVTFRDMQIENTGSTYALCLLLKNQSDYNTFENCKFSITSYNSYWKQIILASKDENSIGKNGDNANYNTFKNNQIIGGYYGIKLHGTNTATMGMYNSITGNDFSSQSSRSIMTYYQYGLEIKDNVIKNGSGYHYGILGYYNAASVISENIIQPGYIGIYVYRENNFYPNQKSYITNNMISNFSNSNYQSGIYAYYNCYNIQIMHNSIWVNSGINSYSYAGIRLWYYPKNSVVKNNLISATNNAMVLSLYYATDAEIDYNNYYYDTNTSNRFYNNAYYSSFSSYKNSSSYIKSPHDQNSFDRINPEFVSKSNLHLDTLNTPSLMGDYIGVNKDIDGDDRDSTFGCNLGADEIRHPKRDLDIISIDSPSVLVTGKNTVTITLRNMGTDSLLPQKIYLSYSFAGNSWVNDSFDLTSKIPPFDTFKFTFNKQLNVTGLGIYELCTRIYPQMINDPDASDSFCMSKCVGLSGSFTIDATGNGDFKTFNKAISALLKCGVSGPVVFNIKSGTYIERVEISEIPGASATNTISFIGTHRDSVDLIYASSYASRATVVLDGADHIILKNINIQSLGSYYCSAIHLRSQADSNIISNCKLEVSTTASATNIAILASPSENTYYSYGNAANYNLFENNIIKGGYFGIRLNGTDNKTLCKGNRIVGNTIKNTYYYGIYLAYQGSNEISGNKITNPSATYGYSIYCYYGTNTEISSNTLYPGRTGIVLYRENNIFTSNRTTVYNNMISDFLDPTYQAGIWAYSYSQNIDIYHNSILIDPTTSHSNYSAISLTYRTDSCNIKNNIIATEGTGYLLSMSYSSGTEIDYNNYYYPNHTASPFLNSGRYYPDLDSFKTSNYSIKYPHDQNSYDNKYPGFISETDLHIHDTVAGLGGDTSLNILTDIDGDPRCASFPTVGADEKGAEANFEVNDSIQCLHQNNVEFTNTSLHGSDSLSFYWNFGDGNHSKLEHPSHIYSNAGTYTVKLTATPNKGCPDSITKNITIQPSPDLDFSMNDSSQCLRNNEFKFVNNSTISSGTASYHWDFGDGYSASLNSPKHSYGASDTYQVKLIATSDLQCKDTLTKNAFVHPTPDADFIINDNSQCIVNNHFKFTNASTVNGGGSLGYLWDFGDQDTSTLTNPSHTYDSIKEYDVSLVAISGYSCTDTLVKTIQTNPMPDADFIINDSIQCLSGNAFTFSNNSNITNGYLAYSWDLDDGSTSSAINVNHSYTYDDTFSVKLIATSSDDCKDSVAKKVYVLPQPDAAFKVNDSTQCLNGNNFSFSNTSTINSGLMNYNWVFGDGSTSSLKEPTHQYTSAGTYLVKLFVTSGKGCSDSSEKYVYVYPEPDVQFSVDDSLQCILGNKFNYSNSSTISSGSLSWYWEFDDGNTSTQKNPSHSYTSAGTYEVSLMATSNHGCQDSVKRDVYVQPSPNAAFTVNDSTQCLIGNSFVFNNTSTQLGSGTSFFSWDFDDGQSSTDKHPTHNFTSAGSYQVKLKVLAGNCTDSAIHTMEVYSSPAADFTINDTIQCEKGNVFNLNNSSSPSSLDYLWSMGDGSSYTGKNPSHSYADTGRYSIKLVVGSTKGCKDSISKNVWINQSPAANFSINDSHQCLNENQIQITDQSSELGSSTPNYNWQFGDGNSSIASNPTYQYLSEGTYQVKLVLTHNNNCLDSMQKSVIINPSPKAAFSINDSIQCLSNNQVQLTNNSAINSGIMNFAWDFGDGNSSSSANPAHSYSTNDTFTIKLISTSNQGCQDSTTGNVYILPGPVANFSINDDEQCLRGNEFEFTDQTTNGGSLSNYSWNFGDGFTASSQNSKHNYLTHGSYNVTLKINSGGCEDSTTKSVTVRPSPYANYIINDTVQCLNENKFTISNYSNIASGNLAYLWDFGDTGTSTLRNPDHQYSAADTYAIKLKITSNYQCGDSLIKNVYVKPSPVAGFNINDSLQCFGGNNFSFTNITSISSGNLSYLWEFGDGDTSSLINPTHSYLRNDTFDVNLVANSDLGCPDTASRHVYVLPSPQADFGVNDSMQCLNGNQFNFTNKSSVSGSSIDYEWDFGDGNTSTSENPQHSYTSAGSYSVKFMVKPGKSCLDSVVKTIEVYPSPEASLSVSDTSQCLSNNSFSFKNTSTLGSGSMTQLWDLGDGNTKTVSSFNHSFTNTGTYEVKLIVTSAKACKDSTTASVTVHSSPSAAFDISNSAQCFDGNKFSFINKTSISSGTIDYSWDFGDMGTSNLQDPVHSYGIADTYDVKLLATSSEGCSDSITKSVYVHPKPQVDFSIDDSSQCLGTNLFSFTNKTSSVFGVSFLMWNLGDGYLSLKENPTHSYNSSGTFDVSLIVTSKKGCKDTFTREVYVNPSPTAAFSTNNKDQCLTGNEYIFTNKSTVNKTPANWLWTFGDGDSSFTQHPKHSYLQTDTFDVKLLVTSAAGCTDTIIKEVVTHPMPEAGFSINDSSQCLYGNQFDFNNNSFINSSSALKYNWNFGDGNASISNATTVRHSYTVDSIYVVQLIATSNMGCKDTLQKNAYVRPEPKAAFDIDDTNQCYEGNKFSFLNQSHINSGQYNSYWEFGDGLTSQLDNPVHQYQYVLGKQTIKLEVESDYGCVDSAFRDIVLLPSPYADFIINDSTQCLNDNKFEFTNLSSISSGYLITKWYFGDGTTTYNSDPVKTFNSAHSYLVALSVSSWDGCKDSIAKIITVYPKPNPIFNVNDSAQCLQGNQFEFTNKSFIVTGNMKYLWDLGDGDTTSVKSPKHKYATDGNYDVKLHITSDHNCMDSINQTVSVFPDPDAKFAINDASQCLDSNLFELTNNSTIKYGKLFYRWTLGDTTSSILKNVKHSFTKDGSYDIKLHVRSGKNCEDSLSKQIKVHPMPRASFLLNDTVQCLNGNLFEFLNTSGIKSGNIYFNWNFGNGNSSTSRDPKYRYGNQGVYTVKLKTVSGFGCRDSFTKQTIVLPSPVVNLGNDTSITNKQNITLDAGSGFKTYLWDDSSTYQMRQVSGADEGKGVHYFSVMVTNQSDCPAYDTIKITITEGSGISELSSIEFKLYPNPARNYVILETGQKLNKNLTVSIISTSGQEVYTREFDRNFSSERISTHDLAKGMYLVKLQYGKEVRFEKLIKY